MKFSTTLVWAMIFGSLSLTGCFGHIKAPPNLLDVLSTLSLISHHQSPSYDKTVVNQQEATKVTNLLSVLSSQPKRLCDLPSMVITDILTKLSCAPPLLKVLPKNVLRDFIISVGQKDLNLLTSLPSTVLNPLVQTSIGPVQPGLLNFSQKPVFPALLPGLSDVAVKPSLPILPLPVPEKPAPSSVPCFSTKPVALPIIKPSIPAKPCSIPEKSPYVPSKPALPIYILPAPPKLWFPKLPNAPCVPAKQTAPKPPCVPEINPGVDVPVPIPSLPPVIPETLTVLPTVPIVTVPPLVSTYTNSSPALPAITDSTTPPTTYSAPSSQPSPTVTDLPSLPPVTDLLTPTLPTNLPPLPPVVTGESTVPPNLPPVVSTDGVTSLPTNQPSYPSTNLKKKIVNNKKLEIIDKSKQILCDVKNVSVGVENPNETTDQIDKKPIIHISPKDPNSKIFVLLPIPQINKKIPLPPITDLLPPPIDLGSLKRKVNEVIQKLKKPITIVEKKPVFIEKKPLPTIECQVPCP